MHCLVLQIDDSMAVSDNRLSFYFLITKGGKMQNVLIELGYCADFKPAQLTKELVISTLSDIDSDLASEQNYIDNYKPLNIENVDERRLGLAYHCVSDLKRLRLEFIKLALSQAIIVLLK